MWPASVVVPELYLQIEDRASTVEILSDFGFGFDNS